MNADRIDLASIRTIHLIAVCGTGMGALAGILKTSGYEITGSDQNVYPPMSDQLETLGIPIMKGYCADHLSHRPDLVIIGNAIRRDNPEARAAIDQGFAYLSFPAALRTFFLAGKKTLAVCGTHGKTTTTALLAHLFSSAGRDPSYLVGGVMINTGNGFRIGNGDTFIIEGDEYDTAFFDKVPKFIRYQPDWAIVANIEFDHADIYDNLDQIKRVFGQLVGTMPQKGILFAGVDCPTVQQVVAPATCRVVTFGLDPTADVHAADVTINGETMRFRVIESGVDLGIYQCAMTGEHNLKNLLAAIAVCRAADMSPERIAEGLSTFQGIKRRQEIRADVNGIRIIDDFAHHPTAVAATLHALKQSYPDRRVIAVFEPRTNTSRRHFFQQRYADAFHDADRVFFGPVYDPDAIAPENRMNTVACAEQINQNGGQAYAAPDMPSLLERLTQVAQPGDLVVVMSNGAFGGLFDMLISKLNTEER